MPRRSVPDAPRLWQPSHRNDSRPSPNSSPVVPETALEVRKQIQESLRMPSLPEAQPTVPQEGHTAEWPLWAFSKKMSTVTRLRIDYEDGTYFQLGTHLRRDTVIPQWFQASKAAAASDGHAVHC